MPRILSKGGRVLKSELESAETKNIFVVVFQKFKFAAKFTISKWQLQLQSKYSCLILNKNVYKDAATSSSFHYHFLLLPIIT